MTRTYTEEEVEQLRKEWESDRFEEKTKEFMVEVTHRLDLSNGYKETIGKDVLEVKNDVKELRLKVVELENARLKEEKAAKEAEASKYQRNQDKTARYIGYASLVLWFFSIMSNPSVGGRIMHVLFG